MTEFTESQIEELKTLLLNLKLELTEVLSLKEESTKPVELDQPAVGRLSRMDSMQHQKMAEATKRSHKMQLDQTEVALRALENGEYGECRICGECISVKRLRVKPEAAFCIECQSKRE